ncbi:aldo/keto reductase [Pseudonocardia kunmingensis]|uniref:Aryl-alcohol dehydrogenase-like predicted oxidoreductase n=1 Tax=Pseudonocardia kunmingensis TaxID=630975 RepID=A0A543CYY0_9PSEU|nr:aldo/keto reductase [Pseudonocardia kunmingensis]TQM02261.1 aryl-alcohol dehydrogenase-like predicted oxidoreductase [Pseudonocardia kunmingensis]
MRYKLLGRTGLRVSEVCLGTMTFGEAWGWGAGKQECARIVGAYAEAGGNFVDTANIYTEGESERILGELIRAERDRWVLATKYVISTDPSDPNAGGMHRKSMTRALEASLRRLGTDHVDLYWLHEWDEFTPVEEVMRALDDVVRAGKVRYVGVSDTPAWRVAQATVLADLRGWTRFAGLQVPYSLVERDCERDLLPMARELGLTVTTWGPLGGGLLTGRYGTDRPRPEGTRIHTDAGYGAQVLTERNLAIADVVTEIAAQREVSAVQVAIGWVRAQQRRASIVPIIGARTAAQLSGGLAALDLELTGDELERLDKVSATPPGFPHDFVGRHLAYGDTLDLIDDDRRSAMH